MLRISRLTSLTSSKILHQVDLTSSVKVSEMYDYGDIRVIVQHAQGYIELRFESRGSAARFRKGVEEAIATTIPEVTWCNLPPAPEGEGDLLGLSEEDEVEEAAEERASTYFNEGSAPDLTSSSSSPTRKSLKLLIQEAKQAGIDTAGMLDRCELEQALRNKSSSTNDNASPKPSLCRRNRPFAPPSAPSPPRAPAPPQSPPRPSHHDLFEQMENIKIHRQRRSEWDVQQRKRDSWEIQQRERLQQEHQNAEIQRQRQQQEAAQQQRQREFEAQQRQRRRQQQQQQQHQQQKQQQQQQKQQQQQHQQQQQRQSRPLPHQPLNNITPPLAAFTSSSEDTAKIINAHLNRWGFSRPNIYNAIQVLLQTIQTTFPPLLINGKALVSPHPYFLRFSPILPTAVESVQGIKRSLRRIRFFLHPDKLPPNLDGAQGLLLKGLWTIISEVEEAWKRKENLS